MDGDALGVANALTPGEAEAESPEFLGIVWAERENPRGMIAKILKENLSFIKLVNGESTDNFAKRNLWR